MDDIQQYPPPCPRCGSEKIDIHRESEYTGGGYADYWDEFECLTCGYIWQSDKDTGLF
jgi:transposase